MGNSLAPWDEAFENVVRSYLFALSAAQPLTPDLNMRAFGLDSYTTYGMLGEVEKLYDVKIPADLLTFETLETPAMLWAAIQKAEPRRDLI